MKKALALLMVLAMVLALAPAIGLAADQTIQYSEEMVGAGHPTKADTLNRLVLIEHNADGTHKFSLRGFKVGLTPGYKDADELTFTGGYIEIAGHSYSLGASTDVTFPGLGNDESRFVYITPGSATALTSSEFSSTTTAPTFDSVRGGWYNAAGTGRCVFLFTTNGSGNIWEFRSNGRAVLYDNSIVDASAITPSATWTDVTLSVPVMDGLIALVSTLCLYTNTNANAYMRTNGSSASTGIRLGYPTGGLAERPLSHVRVAVDSSAKVEVKYQNTTSNTISVYTTGYELPEGM